MHCAFSRMDPSTLDVSSSRSPLRDTTNLSSSGPSTMNGGISQKPQEQENAPIEKEQPAILPEVSSVPNSICNLDLSADDIYESADESLHLSETQNAEASLDLTQLANEFEQVHLSTPKTELTGDNKPLALIFASPVQAGSSVSSDSSCKDDNCSIATSTLSGDLSSNSFTFARGEGNVSIADDFVVPEPVHSLSDLDSCEQTDIRNATTFFSDDKDLIVQNESQLSASPTSGFNDSPIIQPSTWFISRNSSVLKDESNNNSASPLLVETSNLESALLSTGVEDELTAAKEEISKAERCRGLVSKLEIEDTFVESNSASVSAPEEVDFRDAQKVLDEVSYHDSYTSEASLSENITVRENSLCAEQKFSESFSDGISTDLAPPESILPEARLSSSLTPEGNIVNYQVEEPQSDHGVQISEISSSFTGQNVLSPHLKSLAEEEDNQQDFGTEALETPQVKEEHENRDKYLEISGVRESNVEASGASQSDTNGTALAFSCSDFLSVVPVKQECDHGENSCNSEAENSRIEKENEKTRNNTQESLWECERQTGELDLREKEINEVLTSQKIEIRRESLQCPVESGVTPSDAAHLLTRQKTSAVKTYQEILETCAQQERELMSEMNSDFAESIKSEADRLVEDLQLNDEDESRSEFGSFDDILPQQNMMLASMCTEINSEAGPVSAIEDFDKMEFCGNATDFLDCEFLSKIGRNRTAAELKRKSLFVKFDPLLGQDDSINIPEPSSGHTIDNDLNGVASETTEALNSTSTLIHFTPSQNKDVDDPGVSNKPRTSPLREELSKLQEVMLQREQTYEQRDNEALSLKLRIAELESLKTSDLERVKKEKEQEERIAKLNCEHEALTAGNKDLIEVMHAYEKKISQMVANNEELTAKYETEIEEIAKERYTAFEHLRNAELCFNDVHQKFEKAKEAIYRLHSSEQELKKNYEETIALAEERRQSCQKLKVRAIEKLKAANEEIEMLQKNHASEVTRLKAVAKKTEVHCKSLKEALDQKQKEISELTKICDELIGNK